MISHIKGKVLDTDAKSTIIDVNGIGYKIASTFEIISSLSLGNEASFWTHLAVREDALDLYGFKEKTDLELFKLLNTISGIGPKTSIGIMDSATPSSIRKAVISEDPSHLTKMSGISAKVANKIVLELKGKLGGFEDSEEDFKEELEALEALKSLGYNQNEAREALKGVSRDIQDTSLKIKEALKILGR